MLTAVKELFSYRELVEHLVVLDLKVRYRGSFFGFLWTLLNPLLLMVVLWVVFSQVARIDEESYPMFLLCGLMTWTFFSQSVSRSLNAIISNRGLIQKIYVPKLVFPISIVTSNLVNLLFFFVAYVILALVTYRIPVTVLMLVASLLMLYVLSAGTAMLMCALNVFFRDFTHLTSVVLRALFYLTPVFYPPRVFGQTAGALLRMNPVYYPVVLTRDVLYYGSTGSPEDWAVGFAIATLVFVLGLSVFTTTQNKFVYYA